MRGICSNLKAEYNVSNLSFVLPFPYLWSVYLVFISTFSGLVLLSFLLSPSCIFIYQHSTSVLVFLFFGVHPLPCSHYYIFFGLSLHSLDSLIFSLMFASPVLGRISSFPIFSLIFIHIIHLISVLSNKFCSASLSAQVSLPYIRTGLIASRLKTSLVSNT